MLRHQGEHLVDDLREEFVRDFVFPMFRANTIYEGEYLLGTSIARPLIAKRLIEIANEPPAPTPSPRRHRQGQRPGPFRAGRLRAEAGRQGDRAPWREWDLLSREKLMDYAEKHGIPIDLPRQGQHQSPYSMDANLLHISYEGDILEDPAAEPRKTMWRWTVSLRSARTRPTHVELDLSAGRHRRGRRRAEIARPGDG